MKNPWVIIGIITVVLFGGAVWYSSNTAAEYDLKSNEGVVVVDQVKGNQDAEVTLVEYSDFECPACASFQPVLEGVMEEFGDNLRFEYKHFPLTLANPRLHKFSLAAALAAEAAGQQGKFFEYHDVLFARQQEWSTSANANTLFVKYAGELGLDSEKFRTQMKSSILSDKVKADFAEGRALGITGTPTFFLNGEKMEIESYQDFIEQIAVTINPDAAASSSAQTGAPDVRFGI